MTKKSRRHCRCDNAVHPLLDFSLRNEGAGQPCNHVDPRKDRISKVNRNGLPLEVDDDDDVVGVNVLSCVASWESFRTDILVVVVVVVGAGHS